MEIRFLTPARQEFLEAVQFYRSRSQGLAEDLIAEVERVSQALTANPQLGSVVEHGTRRMLLRRFPFALVYELHPDHVLVVALAHHRRRPGYWRDRK